MATRNDIIRRRELIRGRLHIARVSEARIGRECGVSRGLVCHVIAGRKKNPRVETALARVCNLSVGELWGD